MRKFTKAQEVKAAIAAGAGVTYDESNGIKAWFVDGVRCMSGAAVSVDRMTWGGEKSVLRFTHRDALHRYYVAR